MRKFTLLTALMLMVTMVPVFGKVWIVDLNGSGDFTDIQSAIDAAANGDSIDVRPGEYICRTSITIPDKNIRIDSWAGNPTINFDFSASAVIFENGSKVQFNGINITGGLGVELETRDGKIEVGGAVVVKDQASPLIMNCTFYHNGADNGGAIFSVGYPTFMHCIVRNNTSARGGGICALAGRVKLDTCKIQNNWVSTDGGGIYCENASLDIWNSTISANKATDKGGGVYCLNNNQVRVTETEIIQNTLRENRGFYGAGIYCDNSSIEIENTKIDSNGGNGLYLYDGDALINRSYIIGNFGHGIFGAGGVQNSKVYTNCVIAANYEHGIDGTGCNLLINCTVAKNRDWGIGCMFTYPTAINCIVWQNGICADKINCLVDQNPMFTDEGTIDFGRFQIPDGQMMHRLIPNFIVQKPNYQLLPNSPAIDSGANEQSPLDDILGNTRPIGDRVDIGAYEYQGAFILPKIGDANADGFVDLGDAVFILNYLFRDGPTPPLAAADVNSDATIDIGDVVFILAYLFSQGLAPGK